LDVDSLLRLDECQSVAANTLKPVRFSLNDDVRRLLRSQFSLLVTAYTRATIRFIGIAFAKVYPNLAQKNNRHQEPSVTTTSYNSPTKAKVRRYMLTKLLFKPVAPRLAGGS
jgi:hypothetical protein